MLRSLLRTIFGKAADCVLSVIGILYGVVIDDAKQIFHLGEIRKRRKDYQEYKDLVYTVFVDGYSHTSDFHQKMFEHDFGHMSEYDRKVLEASDETYARMKDVLISQMIVDFLVSLASTGIVIGVGIGLYIFWNCDLVQSFLSLFGDE